MTILMGIRRPDFNWEGMMEWWTAHLDGTRSPVSEEEEEEEGVEENIDDLDVDFFDVVQRVQQIAILLNDRTDKRFDIVGPLLRADGLADVLAELQALTEYVDIIKELYIGGHLAHFFHTLLCYKYDAGIYNKHAAVRATAAEIVTIMVHNNPINQQLVMEVNGLQPLLDNVISDPDVTARTKALVAISSLIRNNKPGITAFLHYNGYAALKDALYSESVTLQREALNLIQYLLHENSLDCNVVTQLEFLRIMMPLTSSDDAQVREAALRGLLVLARDEGGQLVRNDDKLKQVLQKLIEGIIAMPPEDLGAAREEIQLVDSLWNAFYNEPSSLAANYLNIKSLLDLTCHDLGEVSRGDAQDLGE